MRIYWANSIFSDADRQFNDQVVRRLEAEALDIVSPQKLPFNVAGHDASAQAIFGTDASMLQSCDILAACIDQEAIDCGVACEIGIAWALGKRIVALYTDFRQFRTGQFRMYKNPFVIGCIQDRGTVVSTLDELIVELRKVG